MAFKSFTVKDMATRGATIHTLRRGAGPPLLLLHGYPQTHFIWHKVATRLSEQYTVVMTVKMRRLDFPFYRIRGGPDVILGTTDLPARR